MAAAIIDDGYTVDLTIPALVGHHPEVKIAYRPATLREMRAIDKAIAEPATIDDAMNATCEFVAKHIAKWDVVDQNGAAVPITPQSVDRLESVLAAQLFNVCRGLFPQHIAAPAPATQDAPKNC
jgi:hypothetical protein